MGKVNFKKGAITKYVKDADSIYFATDTDSDGRYPLYLNGRNYNAGITVDSTISSTSTNPVLNKVVYTLLTKKANSGAEKTATVSGDITDTDYTATFPVVLGGVEGTLDAYNYTNTLKAAPIAIEYSGNSMVADLEPTDGISVSLSNFYQLSLNNGTTTATLTPTNLTVGTTELKFGNTSGTLAVTTDLDNKVSKSGDTMTGTLTLYNKGFSGDGDTAAVDTSKGGITFVDPENTSATKLVLNMTYGGGSLYISDNTPTGTPTVIFKPVSTPTAGSKAVVTSGNLYDALNSSTLTAKILDSVNRSSEVSTVTPNYYTPTSISQGMTLDILNGKVPLFGTSNDNAYKGFINVRFLQGGAGKSEYYGGTPTLQIAVWKNTLYFRTAKVTSGKSWESWLLLQGKPIVKTVDTMVDMEVYPNVYYYCADAIDELSIADTYDSRGVVLSDDFGVGVDGAICEYIFDFIAGSGFTLSFPSNVLWNSTPSFVEGKRYLISVVNGLAVWSEFSSES